MNILGVNLTTTSTGLELDDGAAVLLQDGRPTVAIAEERLNRTKHSGGVAASIDYCLTSAGITAEDLDAIAVTNCCDTPPTFEQARAHLALTGMSLPEERVIVCPSHHMAHAASAFFASPFDQAVVVVCDNEGSIISPRQHDDYWPNRLERTTIWACTAGPPPSVTLVERHGDGPDELSLGAAYNYFTKWLGLKSYHEAGQTMALAAYAHGRFPPGRLFTWQDKRLTCGLAQHHHSKASAVAAWMRDAHSIDIGAGRSSCWAPDDLQHEVAGLVQTELETALVQLLCRATDITGMRAVGLAGGVFLNCIANTRVFRALDLDGLFVQPAASDVGQSLGAALWAQHCAFQTTQRWVMTHASLGKRWPDDAIRAAIEPLRSQGYVSRQSPDPAYEAAELIAQGSVIGWHVAGSEFGPRALGHRSILADPRNPRTKPHLDQAVKHRAPYRPYAPSVLAEQARYWFDLRGCEDSLGSPADFMLMAVDVRPERRSAVPAITHVDGSARVHLVREQTNPKLHHLITYFAEQTGVPLVLNTSFNPAGAPIVETPADSVGAFLRMGLDGLVIEDWIVTPPAQENT